MKHSLASACLAASALLLGALPAQAMVVGDGMLSGDLYAPGGATGGREFHPFFEEVFVILHGITLTSESSLTGAIQAYGSSTQQFLNISGVSLATEVSPWATNVVAGPSAVPGQFTFESLAPGFYWLQVHGQVILENVDYDSAPDWQLGYNLTASAAPTASPAPEVSSLVMTALGLAGVMAWAQRRKPAHA